MKPKKYLLVFIPDGELANYLPSIQCNQFIKSENQIWYYDFQNRNLVQLDKKAYKYIDVRFPSTAREASLAELEEITKNPVNPPTIEYDFFYDAINIHVGEVPLSMETIRYFELEIFDELAERGEIPEPNNYQRFISSFNADISRLNHLIQEYNSHSEDKAGKIARLEILYQEIKHIDAKYSDLERAYFTGTYRQLSVDLFNDIKKQLNILGLNSLDQLATKQQHDSPSKKFLASMISNISNDKAEALIKILEVGKKFDKKALKHLYKKDEPGYDEYQNFLKQYKIKYLGGNNSKNFKIKSKEGVCVLKIANRMHNPGTAEEHLRSRSLSDTLIPVYAERLVSTRVNGKMTERILQVTDYMTAGDIYSFSKEQHHRAKGSYQPDFYSQAIDVYRQMGSILLKVEADGCVFPDMKNTNWLIDNHGILRLADAKSFVFTKDGQVDPEQQRKRWSNLITTPALWPKNLSSAKFSADALHSYILGKNLYQYLTQPNADSFYEMQHSEDFNFSAPIFKTEMGMQLRDLIKKMTLADPNQRMPLKQAVTELQALQMQTQNNKCRALVREIADLARAQQKGLLFLDLVVFWSESLAKINHSQSMETLKREYIALEASLTLIHAELKSSINLIDELKELATFHPDLKVILEQTINELKSAKTPDEFRQINLKMRHTLENSLSPLSYECFNLLKQIKATAFKNDAFMNRFVLETGQKIMRAEPKELESIKQELSQIYRDPTTRAIKEIIRELKTNLNKADALSEAMRNIPVQDRRKIMQDQSTTGLKVQSLVQDSALRTFSIFRAQAEQQMRQASAQLKLG